MDMMWGQFGILHILTLIAAAGIIVGLYFVLKRASGRTQDLVLGMLSFSGIVAVVYNYIVHGSLPLQMCSLTALLLPVLVFTKNQVVGNLLLLWGLGAGAALVYNVNVAAAPIFGTAFNLYYFPHVMECGIPWLMLLLGKVKKHPKYILATLGITAATYTVVHFINLALDTNYMYSMGPTTPLAQLLWDLLPCRYWYMYLLIPIVAVFFLAVFTPEQRRKK